MIGALIFGPRAGKTHLREGCPYLRRAMRARGPLASTSRVELSGIADFARPGRPRPRPFCAWCWRHRHDLDETLTAIAAAYVPAEEFIADKLLPIATGRLRGTFTVRER